MSQIYENKKFIEKKIIFLDNFCELVYIFTDFHNFVLFMICHSIHLLACIIKFLDHFCYINKKPRLMKKTHGGIFFL